jgi:hypothetical protein
LLRATFGRRSCDALNKWYPANGFPDLKFCSTTALHLGLLSPSRKVGKMDVTKPDEPEEESVYSHAPEELLKPYARPPERPDSAAASDEEKEMPAPPAKLPSPHQAGKRAEPEATAHATETPKDTRRTWLIVAGSVVGLLVVIVLLARVVDWIRNAREKGQEQAILEVTPDSLVAQCGPPAADETKDLYPVLSRTMTYQRGASESIVFTFSRTAEKKSDWVFLSMKEQTSSRSYEDPAAKISAMPCLASKKVSAP